MDREPRRLRVALLDQVLRGGDEVVEDSLLLLAHAGMVPSLAVLRAAAQVGYRVDAARIEPGGGGGGEGRRDGDVEPAVGIEQGVVVAVELGALAQGDEDRDLGA